MRHPASLEPLEDRLCLATFTVNNVNDVGAGSLRAAIAAANAAAGPDDVRFNIGAGPARQNYPAVTLVSPAPTTTTVKGTLKSTPATNFHIDVYASPAPHASGFGQGQQYLGSFTATTDAAGAVDFAHTFLTAVPGGWVIAATAQAVGGGTSEFSAAVTVPDVVPPTVVGAEFDITQGPEHRVLLKFSEDVFASLQRSDFRLRNLTTTHSYDVDRVEWDPSSLAATFFFGQTLPDGNYQLTALAAGIGDHAGNALDGDTDGTGGDDFTHDFHVLRGDANRDRRVDFNDLVFLAQNYNTAGPDLNWFLADFNYDHRVDFNDLVLLAQRYNTSLPAPAPALPARAPTPSFAIAATSTPRFSTTKIVPELPTKPKTVAAPKRVATLARHR